MKVGDLVKDKWGNVSVVLEILQPPWQDKRVIVGFVKVCAAGYVNGQRIKIGSQWEYKGRSIQNLSVVSEA